MPVSNDYIEFIRDLLAAFAPLHIKRMFGGAGVYSGELFFAILADDTLYFKADDLNRPAYEKRGLKPFSFEMKTGRTSTMSYYPVPADALDDPDSIREWAGRALEAARRAPRKPNTRKSRSQPAGRR